MLVPGYTHVPINSQLLMRLSACGKRCSGDLLSFFLYLSIPEYWTNEAATGRGKQSLDYQAKGRKHTTHPPDRLQGGTGWGSTYPLLLRKTGACGSRPTGLVSAHSGHGPTSGQWVRRGLLGVGGEPLNKISSLLRENPKRRQFLWTLLLGRTRDSDAVTLPSTWGRSQH